MPRTGTGRIFQRGKTWWIDYSVRGKRYRESSESTKRADATKLLKQRLGEQGSGRFIGPAAERVTFGELVEGLRNHYTIKQLKTADRMELSVKHLVTFFRSESRAIDITDDRVIAYAIHRQGESAAQATIQRELMALSKMFKLAGKKLGSYPRPVMPALVEPGSNTRRGFLDGDDLDAVVGQLPEPLRPVVRFAAFTGWRKGEILSLTWAQVDADAGVIRLEPGTTKNRDGRIFPYGELPPLAALLDTQRERTRAVERETGRIVPWVFHRDGNRIKTLRTAWDAACRRAGVPDAIFHDLRRTAVRNLVRAGVPEKTAMKLVGHKTRSIFDRYNITNEADQRAGVGKLAAYHASRTGEGRTVVPLRAAEG